MSNQKLKDLIDREVLVNPLEIIEDNQKVKRLGRSDKARQKRKMNGKRSWKDWD